MSPLLLLVVDEASSQYVGDSSMELLLMLSVVGVSSKSLELDHCLDATHNTVLSALGRHKVAALGWSSKKLLINPNKILLITIND